MSKIWQQLLNIWSKLEIAQKATVVLAVLGMIALSVVLVVGASQPDYRLLAKGLTRSQVAEIASYLESNHIKYQVQDNETAIMIPSANLYKVRNDLAQQDMLGDGSKGFEILGKTSSMWESTFSEHRTYDRAVAGELERSFRELNGVRSARVMIDRPQPSPFIGDEGAKPKASIKVDMRSGMRLTDRQIAGIIHLTAGTVAGLTPDRVEIMDGSGLLTPKSDGSGAGMAQTSLDAEVAREAYLTRRAQEQMDAVLGPGRGQVKVSVKLDFTKRTESSRDPTRKETLEETTTTTNDQNETANPGGIAGTAANVEGENPSKAAPPLKGSKNKEETTAKYVVGQKTVTQEDEIGRVRGMNVSILLPFKKTMKPKMDDKGKPTKEMEEVSEEYSQADKDRFKELVLNAIGFNAAKDIAAKVEASANLDTRFTSSVQSMELWHNPQDDIAAASMSVPLSSLPWFDIASYVGAGLVALVMLGVARGQLKRSHKAWKDAEERARMQVEEEIKKTAPPPPPPETEEDREVQVMKTKRSELREQIRKKIDEDPAIAAEIVRKWLYQA